MGNDRRREACVSQQDLWLRYFELGGMSTPDEVESHLRNATGLGRHDEEVLSQALDEQSSELGTDHRLESPAPAPRRLARCSAGAAEMHLGILGRFALSCDAQPLHLSMNAQRLVCFLALHDGLVLRQHVAGSLWPDTTEHRAAGSLRSALWRLGGLPRPVVEVADSHLRLLSNVAVDVRASEALARRVLDHSRELSESDLDERALLSSDLLPDWTEDWVLAQRNQHSQLRLRALEALCVRLSELGRFDEAVEAGMHAVSCEPLRESAQRALVTAHLAAGNVAAAIVQYEGFRDLLRDDLDLAPSSEMQQLVQHLLHR